MSQYTRTIGRIFHSVSVTDASRDCVRAMHRLGGAGQVMVSQGGECVVLATGTVMADRAASASPGDLVGAYEAHHPRDGEMLSKLIEADIWHHMGEQGGQAA